MRPVYRLGNDLYQQIEKTNVPPEALAFWTLGQEGIALKGQRHVVYFDPYLSNYFGESDEPETDWTKTPREFPPVLDPGTIRHASLVLCSHQHLDHIDPWTLGPMAKASPQAKFIVPAPHVALLTEAGIERDRIIPARDGERINWKDIRIMPVRAAHEQFEVNENGDHLYLGYIVQIDGLTVYHAGDTIGFTELVDAVKPFKPDIAFLPINGRDFVRNAEGIVGNMNYREAAALSAAIEADLLVPLHFDLFAFNSENPAYFVDFLYHHHPRQRFHISLPGERFVYFKER